MNRILKTFILIFFLFLCIFSNSQTKNKSLIELLSNIETTFNVKFSYETSVLKSIKSSLNLNEISNLKEALDLIALETNIEFLILDDNFIAIRKKETKDINRLEEIVITNFLSKGISKTNTGGIEINSEKFNILSGVIEPDLFQILQKIPGVISVDERISNINIRGGKNDENLIYFEGIRLFQTGHFFGLISAFNANTTKELLLSKNGTSARYGDAVSGTILLKNNNTLNKELNFGLGSNLINSEGSVAFPINKKISVQISAKRSFTDLIKTNTYNNYFDRIFQDSELNFNNQLNNLLALDEKFLFYDITGKLLYNINSKQKLRINFISINNDLNYNRLFSTTNNRLKSLQSALQQNNFGIGINYNYKIDTNTEIISEIYYSDYALKSLNNDLFNDQLLRQENKVNDIGLKIDISKSYENLKVTGGYQFNEIGVSNFEDVNNPNFRSFVKEVLRTHALYGEIERFSNSKNTYLRLGARINYFNKLADITLEPRFAFNQKLTSNLRLEVLGELKSQTLSQVIDLQQDFLGIEKRRWTLTNGEDIPLIKSQQVSLGINYKKNNLLISIDGYYKNVSNISSQNQGFQNQFQFTTDIGQYNIKGFDFIINKRFNNLNTWISYTFSDNDYKFETLNNNNAFASNLDIRHNINSNISYRLNNLNLAIGFNWHSGRAYTGISNVQESSATITFKEPNTNNLPDYFRTDISAIYKFKFIRNSKAELGFSMWNIFNNKNIINRYFTRNEEGEISQIDNRALKLTPNISFKINF